MTIQRNCRHKHKSEKHSVWKRNVHGLSTLSNLVFYRYLGSAQPRGCQLSFRSNLVKPFGSMGRLTLVLPQFIEQFLPLSPPSILRDESLCSIGTQLSGFDQASCVRMQATRGPWVHENYLPWAHSRQIQSRPRTFLRAGVLPPCLEQSDQTRF